MNSDTPDEDAADEATAEDVQPVTTDQSVSEDVQPPTTAFPEWAFERPPIKAGDGKGQEVEPPSTVDVENRNDD